MEDPPPSQAPDADAADDSVAANSASPDDGALPAYSPSDAPGADVGAVIPDGVGVHGAGDANAVDNCDEQHVSDVNVDGGAVFVDSRVSENDAASVGGNAVLEQGIGLLSGAFTEEAARDDVQGYEGGGLLGGSNSDNIYASAIGASCVADEDIGHPGGGFAEDVGHDDGRDNEGDILSRDSNMNENGVTEKEIGHFGGSLLEDAAHDDGHADEGCVVLRDSSMNESDASAVGWNGAAEELGHFGGAVGEDEAHVYADIEVAPAVEAVLTTEATNEGISELAVGMGEDVNERRNCGLEGTLNDENAVIVDVPPAREGNEEVGFNDESMMLGDDFTAEDKEEDNYNAFDVSAVHVTAIEDENGKGHEGNRDVETVTIVMESNELERTIGDGGVFKDADMVINEAGMHMVFPDVRSEADCKDVIGDSVDDIGGSFMDTEHNFENKADEECKEIDDPNIVSAGSGELESYGRTTEIDRYDAEKEDNIETRRHDVKFEDAHTDDEDGEDEAAAGDTQMDGSNVGEEEDNEDEETNEGEKIVEDTDVMEEEEDEKFDQVDETANTSSAGGEDAHEEGATQMEEDSDDDDDPPPLVNRKGGVRRKRARALSKVNLVKPKLRKKDGEEVCFICFDNGELVACDRRGCSKVYHASCVNRDEAFFHSKGRWNCGWHICSDCQKPAHFMCFTCTYSLCKGCVKGTKFFSWVKGQNGFCETCLNTVLLIENKERALEHMDGINFDDKDSWWYLFKEYWLNLKERMSLTPEDISLAKSRLTGFPQIIHGRDTSNELPDDTGEQGGSSDSSPGRQIGSTSSKKRTKRQSRNSTVDTPTDKGSTKKSSRVSLGRRERESATQKKTKKQARATGLSVRETESVGTSTPGRVSWASKELLNFVAHMRDGDKSVLSQFDVQELLLKYITQNKLRDPRKKSYIVCDPMLQTLFGKPRVGHFEMLKLLESHFFTNEFSQIEADDNQGGVVDPDPNVTDADGNSEASLVVSSDKKRKSRRKNVIKGQSTNYDDYAAIDVHNINLVYLRRNLVEELLDDMDTFDEKVIGTFVRIRISGSSQRQDVYRLVRVVGIGEASEKYKTGKKATNVTLEILNLDKKEIITIDIVSNQGFNEEECKRLRQSVKYGFIPRLRVGEIQEKARVLQALRVNDWLETEKLKLQHLRDRASDMGHKKELRECVEKLQLLSTPEERARRLREEPDVHADPTMDPDYESSEEQTETKDNYERQREPFRVGSSAMQQGKDNTYAADAWKGSQRSLKGNWDQSTSLESPTAVAEKPIPSYRYDKSPYLALKPDTSNLGQTATGIGALVNNNQREPSDISSKSLAVTPATGVAESEKIWHYVDPAGKIQGPFSMVQLRKWNTTGYFPPNMKIWKASESQDDSILLSNALIGNFQREMKQADSQTRIKNIGHGNSSFQEESTKYGTGVGNNRTSGEVNPWSLQSQLHNNSAGIQHQSSFNDRSQSEDHSRRNNVAVAQDGPQGYGTSNVQFAPTQANLNPVLSQALTGNYFVGQNIAAQTAAPSGYNSVAPLVPLATNAVENVPQQSAQYNQISHILAASSGNPNATVDGSDSRLQESSRDVQGTNQASVSTSHQVGGQSGSHLVAHDMEKVPRAASAHDMEKMPRASSTEIAQNAMSTSVSIANPSSDAAPSSNNVMDSGANKQSFASTATQAKDIGNANWGNAQQANPNAQWNMLAPPNMNMTWGSTAPGTANINSGVGMAVQQPSAIPGMGWVTQDQVNANMNAAWAASQGQANQGSAMFNAQLQGLATAWGVAPNNPNVYPGMMAQGSANPNQIGGWSNPPQGNFASGYGRGNNQTNMDNSGWNNHRDGGGRHHGPNDDFHGGGRWNRPPRFGGGGDGGICGFYMRGHCLKGNHCNHYHPPRTEQ